MATWKKMIDEELNGEEMLACTLTQEELIAQFDDGYGGSEGKYFLAWTETRVLFPVVYDGAEWVGSAPRNPREEGQEHVGGQ